MRKYQLGVAKLLVKVTSKWRIFKPKPSCTRIISPSPALSLVERKVRDVDEVNQPAPNHNLSLQH